MQYILSHIKTSLDFGSGLERTKNDFRIISSDKFLKKSYDFLLFTDSKGSILGDARYKCWTCKLFSFLEKHNFSVLFISRPKEMTTFITLINFLNLNKIEFKYLITNVGYADLTPSKSLYINDIKQQISKTYLDLNLSPIRKEKYKLSDGKSEFLFSYNFGHIEKDISMFLSKRFNGCLLLGTMLISKKIIINRRRPSSFYGQLNESNIFIKKISEFNSNLNFFIPIYKQTIKMKEVTHDGVHFTKYGHNLFYTKLKKHILSNDFKYFK